jgi:pimeloyl-ACP methyl ester carboxylesterase
MTNSVTLQVRNMKIAADIAGKTSRQTLLLLHGWPHCRALYEGVLETLSADFFVLAPDLPEIGSSRGGSPSSDKSTLADIMLTAAESVGTRDIIIAGLDVGGMIAFAAARDHSSRISAAIAMNTVIPGIDPWSQILSDRRIWHFAFHAVPDLPEALVRGHERL